MRLVADQRAHRPAPEPPQPRPNAPLAGGAGVRAEEAVARARTISRQLFPRPQTTQAGLDRVFVYIIVALRLVDMAQLVPALLGTVGRSPHPAIDLLMGAIYLSWGLVLVSLGVRDGSLRRRPWLVQVDIAIACLCLLSVLVVTPPSLRDSQWDAWGGSVAYTAALFAGMALRRRSSRFAAAGALWICALIPTGFVPGHPEIVLTGWTNSLIYPAYTAIGYIVSDYFRRVAEAADEARRVASEVAARSAASAEAARHRALLHDQATILDLVSRRIEDPALADALRRQAALEARKVAAFMTEAPLSSPTTDDTDLALLAQRITHEFADLRLDVSVDLAHGAVLRAPVAAVVGSALTTLLHNVRRHAQAEHCVVHADADERGWELLVRDDGVGFDPQGARTGYGLGELVERACRDRGLEVTVESAPGEGTTVTLRGGPDTLVPRIAAPSADRPLARGASDGQFAGTAAGSAEPGAGEPGGGEPEARRRRARGPRRARRPGAARDRHAGPDREG